MGYVVLNTYFPEDINEKPLYLLGKSIEIMSECDAVYFCTGWSEKRGCRIERQCAIEYGLTILKEIE